MKTTDFLYIATALCPDRPFIVFEGHATSFPEFGRRVNKLANALIALGVKKGDRVAVLHVNCPEYVESYFATARVGGIFVPLNCRAKSHELAYMISNAKVKVLLGGSRYFDVIRKEDPGLGTVERFIAIDGKVQGAERYEELVASAPANEVPDQGDQEDITVLMYTAGTTGRPKGVPLRHSGFVSYVLENMEPASPGTEERNLLTVPLYHVAGMQAMLAGTYGGRTLVLMRQFEVKEWLKTVQEQRVTRAMLVPTMLKWVIEDPDFHSYDLSSLRVITYGAAPMPFNVIRKAIAELPGVHFVNAFGQTETASTITMLGPEDHILEGTQDEQSKKLGRLASSIGRPLPDVAVKVVDREGHALPAGEVGEICAKGPRIMSGYWEDSAKSLEVMTEDGWLRTGDKGWMDEEGYIYLAGRGDDMIIRGGENISPEEVENVLLSHPKIEDAAVIGVQDPEWGQEPRAVVVLKGGESVDAEEIMEYCRARLASYKRPRSVVFVEDLPRNQMGKVLKKELRDQYGNSEGT